MPKSKQKVISWAVLASVVAVAVGSFWIAITISRSHRFEIIDLPRDDEIRQMTATVFVRFGMGGIRECDIPPQYVSILMRALRPAGKSMYFSQWPDVYPPIGEMVIHTRSGRTIRIVLYDTGKCGASFTVDGTACFRVGEHKPVYVSQEENGYVAESGLICDIIREISKEHETQRKSDRLTIYIERLRRSIGELP